MLPSSSNQASLENHHLRLDRHYWRCVKVSGTTPVARHAFASALYNDKFYVFGGYGQGGLYLSDSWVLDVPNTTWSYFPMRVMANSLGKSMPPLHSAAFALLGSKLYLFGGITQKGIHIGFTQIIDLDTGEWQVLEPTPTPKPRWGASLVEFNGNLYLFGGFGSEFFNDLWKFEASSNTWSELKPAGVPTSRHYHSATVYNSKMYIIGGYRGSAFTSDIWTYTFDTNRWIKVVGSNSLSNRRGHVTIHIPNTPRCVIVAGRDDTKRLSDVIDYNLEDSKYILLSCAGDKPPSKVFHSGFWYNGSVYVFAGLHVYNTNDLLRYVVDFPEPRRGSRIDYTGLLYNSNFSDVKFTIGSVSIPAHKVILCASSNYFEAMFKSGMKESNDQVVEVTDFSESIFRSILEFIYTGATPIYASNVFELLVAADKFLLIDLITDLELAISSILEHSTVKDILELAIKVPSAKATLDRCISFLRSNIRETCYVECKRLLKMLPEYRKELKALRKESMAKLQQSTTSPRVAPPLSPSSKSLTHEKST